MCSYGKCAVKTGRNACCRFRFKMSNSNSPVVPANAGTHNHRTESLRQAITPTHRDRKACGYGSRVCARDLTALARRKVLACPGRQWKTHLRIPAARTRPGFAKIRVPRKKEGAGNAGRQPHPQPRGQKRVGGPQAQSLQVAERSGIPCTMVYGLLRALAGVPGLLASVAREIAHGLDPSVGGPRPHDLTVRFRRTSPAHQSVHRIPSNVS
jgi:hypothetical protein